MFTITETRLVGPDVKRFEIHAPRIAAKQRPGQFVILRLHEKGERILTFFQNTEKVLEATEPPEEAAEDQEDSQDE